MSNCIFLNPYKFMGNILINNDEMMVVSLEYQVRTLYDNATPSDVSWIQDIVKTNPALSRQHYWESMYPNILFIRKTKTSERDEISCSSWIMNSKLFEDKIEEEQRANGYEYRIRRQLNDIHDKMIKVNTEKDGLINLAKVFRCGHLKANDASAIYIEEANGGAGSLVKLDFSINEADKTISISPPINDVTRSNPLTLVFSSQYDRVIFNIPTSDEDLLNKIQKIISRKVEVKSSKVHYAVYTLANLVDYPNSTVRCIPNMTTDAMIAFFGGHKRRGSKIETFSECVYDFSRRSNSGIQKDLVGKKFYIVLANTHSKNNRYVSPNILSLDSVLTMAPFLKVLSSNAMSKGTAILAEYCDSNCDDFVNFLYSAVETKGFNGVSVLAFGEKSIKTMVESL